MGNATMELNGDTAALDELDGQIVSTLEEMSGTLHALHDKLTVEHVKEKIGDKIHDATLGRVSEAKDSVSESLHDAGHAIGEKLGSTHDKVADFTTSAIAMNMNQSLRKVYGLLRRHIVPIAITMAGAGIMAIRMRSRPARRFGWR